MQTVSQISQQQGYILIWVCSDTSNFRMNKVTFLLRSIVTVYQHLPHITYASSFMFLGKHQKVNTFSDLIELSNQNPRRRQRSLWLWCLPQALGSWESQWLLQEVGTPCPLIAIEQYGSSTNSKWAWFWWILYKYFLYLHLWSGQTYMFT